MVFASTVRFTTNTALTGPLFGGLWVGLLSGYIVSLTWVSSLFLGCCLFWLCWWFVFGGVCVHCAVHDQHGL